MKKVLLTYGFLIFFKIHTREISFKMLLLTLYLPFHLKLGKIIFHIVQRHTEQFV